MTLCRAGVIFTFLLLMAAAPATGPTTTPADVEELRQKALSENFDVSRVALRALIAKGATAKPAVRQVVQELLSRDKAKVMENAGSLADVAKYKEIEQKLAAQRKLARDNIGVLERENTVKEAAENYRVLGELWKESAAPLKSGIFDAMRRRPELLGIWRQTPTPAGENPFLPADEAEIVQLAEKGMGMTVMQASVFAAATDKNEPRDQTKWNFWFYRICREVEAYNNGFERLLDKEETTNVRATNSYREALGII